MPFRADDSQADYDWPGDLWERTVLLQAESAPILAARPVMPGGLVPPFVPLLRYRDGFLDVEVRG